MKYHEALIFRITPAPAGKTQRMVNKNASKKDHPRTCGENKIYKNDEEFVLGSPPHLRGKLIPVFSESCFCGITPAPAGKTIGYFFIFIFLKDHPRTCGENKVWPFSTALRVGSPPHLRGKQRWTCYEKPRTRITPAPAGKTRPLLHTYLYR